MTHVLVRGATIVALALSAGCTKDATGPTVVTIASPASVTELSGVTDSQWIFRIIVPASATRLAVTTSGIGNVDLYVHRGSVPRLDADPDCASTGVQANESCVFEDPLTGSYFILIKGASSYNNVRLTAVVTTP